jgi:heterodisulfide reductase subunit B
MKYLYYPGCSLEGTAAEYNHATRALMEALGDQLQELDDWTCCGATAADAASELLALVLPARNLALAEKAAPGRDVLVPCSACYLNLKKVEHDACNQPVLLARINSVLAEEQLAVSGRVAVRHLLDVLAREVGPQRLARQVTRPLTGLRVAAYYGCQCLRPYRVFDDPEEPTSMSALIAAAGAQVLPWRMGSKCCGASHMNTKPEVGLELTGAILQAARGADAIVTVCPMCQMNLEGYQKKISRSKAADLAVSILYLPQLLGLALGLSEQQVGLHLNLAVTEAFRTKLKECLPVGRWQAVSA